MVKYCSSWNFSNVPPRTWEVQVLATNRKHKSTAKCCAFYWSPVLPNSFCYSDAKIWNKSNPDSDSDFRINLYPDVRRISFQNCGYIRRRHSFR